MSSSVDIDYVLYLKPKVYPEKVTGTGCRCARDGHSGGKQLLSVQYRSICERKLPGWFYRADRKVN